jgi:hypothetical protein
MQLDAIGTVASDAGALAGHIELFALIDSCGDDQASQSRSSLSEETLREVRKTSYMIQPYSCGRFDVKKRRAGKRARLPENAFSSSGHLATIVAPIAIGPGADKEQGGVIMSRIVQVAVGSLIVLTLIVSPAVYAVRQQAQMRNFRVVRPGVLYRSGQMTKTGLQHAINDYHIRTIISLRDGQSERDRAEEEFCKSEDIHFVRILPGRWGDEGGSVPVEAGVQRFREIMSDPRNFPVLMHCFAGIHRAGSYCAIYRMEFEHWTNAQAIAEMRECGYTNLDDELDILGFMEQYRPTWMPPAETKTPASAPAEVKEKKTTKHTKKAIGRRKPAGGGDQPAHAGRSPSE